MNILIGALLGVFLLIFVVLPVLVWKYYGCSYLDYLKILIGRNPDA